MRALFIAGFNQSWISKTTDDFWMVGLWRSLSKYSLRGEITITDSKKQWPPPQEIFTNVSLGLPTWPANTRSGLGGADPSLVALLHLLQEDKTSSSSCFSSRWTAGSHERQKERSSPAKVPLLQPVLSSLRHALFKML